MFSELNIHKVSPEIPNRLIKIACEQLSVPFTFIYNKSHTSRVVADIFKISRVTPIYKNGNITDPNNYRPISILSPFSIVLEKIVHDQMLLFLEKNKILFPYQFGFRPKAKNIKNHLKNITQANHVKYLGVYLQYFSWEHQIKHINIKVNKDIGIITKLRHYVDLKMLKLLYYTLIYPYLNYGIMSWGNTCTSN